MSDSAHNLSNCNRDLKLALFYQRMILPAVSLVPLGSIAIVVVRRSPPSVATSQDILFVGVGGGLVLVCGLLHFCLLLNRWTGRSEDFKLKMQPTFQRFGGLAHRGRVRFLVGVIGAITLAIFWLCVAFALSPQWQTPQGRFASGILGGISLIFVLLLWSVILLGRAVRTNASASPGTANASNF